ncbi:NPCBM/NEW2 domain-containing protein [Kitasatospora sp. NPDC056181]|uniref:NPCBM/NEW2 domain-containing protein n=1 Tax=Kitasatospora sp. NPDC056181 TaxID=3345737 RepID=UPI0035D9BD8C
MGRTPGAPLRGYRRAIRLLAATATAGLTAVAVAACGSGGSSPAASTTAAPATRTVTVTATAPSASDLSASPTPGSPTSGPPGSGSPTTTFTAGTQYLSDNDPFSSTYGVENGAALVNGTNYAHSVSLRTDLTSIPSNAAEYNLERSWQTFSATIGARDDSPTGTVLTFEVLVDGRSVAQQTLSLGQSQQLTVDVRNALRLKIVVTYATTADLSPYSYGVWGDARLGA